MYPSWNAINNGRPLPTDGERKLLEFLDENYGPDYEVYFQPYFNEARPDIVVMKKGGGAMIFEVKDWKLSNYQSTPTGTWIVRADGSKMRHTPIRQVVSYKDKLYSLYSHELFERKTLKQMKGCWGLVSCAVFFHGSTEKEVENLCYPPNISDGNRSFLRHIHLLGDDSLTKKKIDSLFYDSYLSRCSRYFDVPLYEELRRLFKPDIHTLEQGCKYELSDIQARLAVSEEGARKRIKGVAGSGKSFVLARRAVNAHKRTNGNVLILTYNITLINYLHDRISEVRENFDWKYFHFQNYHQLFNCMLDACSMSVMDIARAKFPEIFTEDDDKEFEPDDEMSHVSLTEAQLDAIYSDGTLFDGHEKDLERFKYDVVLIDEAQDYKESWIRIIMKHVATPDAEIVVFADEKQNVYEREVDANRFPVIPVATGRWDQTLNTTYRLNTEIGELAVAFQKHFLSNRYVLDDRISPAKQMMLLFERVHVEYHFHEKPLTKDKLLNIARFIRGIMKRQELHANDITILGANIQVVREVGAAYAKEYHENVNCMCETPEEFSKVSGIEREVKKIRRYKKLNFWQNTGAVSFSSIHSFKGLESPAIVLIVGSGINDSIVGQDTVKITRANQELVYVGITRSHNYLYVINYGDESYDEFFNSAPVKEILNRIA